MITKLLKIEHLNKGILRLLGKLWGPISEKRMDFPIAIRSVSKIIRFLHRYEIYEIARQIS